MNIPEGENLGVTGYKLSYKDGSTVVIDREPTEFEARECLIEPIMIDRAAPTPPAQDDEPVAWVEVKDSHNGPYEFHGQELLPPGKHNLYTRPDNSGLRKAAERVIHCWRRENWTDGMPDLSTCLKWLNDALEEK